MSFSPLVSQLMDALRCLPGVGPKTAQRMAFDLLEHHRDQGIALANVIKEALHKIKHCKQCRTFSETELCALCKNPKRDRSLLCIVETPADIVAIEQTGIYHGLYFVLMGRLSPLDGIGPEELGMNLLKERLQIAELKEIILATNHSIEGEATAHYIIEMTKPFHVKITRIAHGVPLGSELEYVDSNTLAQAISGRGII